MVGMSPENSGTGAGGEAGPRPVVWSQILASDLADLEALLVVGDMRFALFRGHSAQRDQGALDLVAAHVVQGPHVLLVERQVRLGDQGLTVGTDETHVLNRVGQIPAVIHALPFAMTAEAAHRRGRPSLVFAL